MVVPALLRSVAIEGLVPSRLLVWDTCRLNVRRAGLLVMSFDRRLYEDPLRPDIKIGDIRELASLKGFAWVVTKLPIAISLSWRRI